MVVIGPMQDHGAVSVIHHARRLSKNFRTWPWASGIAWLLVVLIAAEPAAAGERRSRRERDGGRIEASGVVPSMLLPGGVPLGGLSDLAHDPARDDETRVMWAVTDRGPNGTVEADGRTWRTLLHPEFSPCLVRLSLRVRGGDVSVERVVPLHGRSGRPCSGRINGAGRDSPIRDSSGASSLPPDPLGVDPEGVVRLPDGTFWIAEEYRPSLLKVAADGTVLARFIPEGESLPGADTEVRAVVVNDNDFGVEGKDGPARRTCLWTIELPRPLPGR